MNIKRRKLFIAAVFSLSFLFIAFHVAKAEFKYHLLEAIPGFYAQGEELTEFPPLIVSIYKFGIWTVGIAGLFMLVVGGFMYSASAGNNATAENAKKLILDALVGVVVAMSAYLIMYVINPDLTGISIAFPEAVDITLKPGVNNVYRAVGNGRIEPAASCKSSKMLDRMKNDTPPGIDSCFTFALLSVESECNPGAISSRGACGISQMMPSTAGKTCDWLRSNIDEAIKMGMNQLMQNKSKVRGNLSGTGKDFDQAVRDLYASYNGGPGALSSSKDCASDMLNEYGYPFAKWDCPIKQGNYVETVRATTEFLNFYKKCKSGGLMN